MQSNNIHDEKSVIKTNNNCIFNGFGASFFDDSIFNYLNENRNLTTKNKGQSHQSVTLFPVEKGTDKCEMPSFTLGAKPPFKYQGGPFDNKFIGLAVNLSDIGITIKESSKVNACTHFGTGIPCDGIYFRGNNSFSCPYSLRRPEKSNTGFLRNRLEEYSSYKEYLQGKKPYVISKSPVKIKCNPDTNHVFNYKVKEIAEQNNIPEGMASLLSTRMTQNKWTGQVHFPYNEYVITTNKPDNELTTTFVVLDGRKRVPLTGERRVKLFQNLVNFSNYKHCNIYYIDKKDFKIKRLYNTDHLRQAIDSICG